MIQNYTIKEFLFKNIICLIFSGFKLERRSFINNPILEKTLSHSTEVAWQQNILLTKIDKCGKLYKFCLHHSNGSIDLKHHQDNFEPPILPLTVRYWLVLIDLHAHLKYPKWKIHQLQLQQNADVHRYGYCLLYCLI